MKNLIVLIAGCLLAVSASAQKMNIEQKAQEVARDVQRYGRSLTGSERSEVAQKLESISRILRGGSDYNDGGMDPSSRSEYTCVSKDNDGVAPYVIAVRTGIDIERLSVLFKTQTDCKMTLENVRMVGSRTGLICISKDNDGVSPYQIATIDSRGIDRIERTIVSTYEGCRTQLNGLNFNRNNKAVFCTSRDNDGAAPYSAAELDLESRSVRLGTESFNSKEKCEIFARQ